MRRRAATTPPKLILLVLLAAAATGCSGRDDAGSASTAVSDTVRILAYNIHHGEGTDEVLDLERIAALIRSLDPDLVALQEIDSVAARTQGVDQAAELGRLTGLDAHFGRFMAYDGGAYGMALLSKWEVVDVVNHRLPDGTEPRSALTATVVSPRTGERLQFVGIHFYETPEERLAQATTLEELLAPIQIPTILAGDFNSTPESPVMQRLAEAWHIVDKGDDRLTFSSFEPVREIDFVLLQPGERFEVIGESLLDEPVASDHRPVLVDLVVHH